MNRRWTIILSLLALLVVPAALAQDLETRGTLTAKDDTMLTVETTKGQVVTFEINEQSLLPEELSVGDFISVHHLAGTGDSNLQPITEVLIADDLSGDGLTGDDPTGDDLTGDDLTGDDRRGDEFDEVLPQTAGPLAALLLIGLAATGGAAGLRRRRS
jgi:hypothetical protein